MAGKHTSPSLSFWGILMGIILFVAINIIAGGFLKQVRIDLTEAGLFTLSESSRAVLDTLEEPISLELYVSRTLVDAAPRYAVYADRVQDTLEALADRTGGTLSISLIDPAPFSPEEDRAVAAGLQGVPLTGAGDAGYFGLVGRNSTDDTEIIGFFALEREAFLEYDLVRLVYDLANPDKPVLGLIDGIQMSGSQMTGFQPWQVLEDMRALFRVREISGGFDSDFEDLDLLVLVHPKDLDDATLLRIDQSILSGKPAVIFVDPHAEADAAAARGGMGMGAMMGAVTGSSLDALFTRWGVAFTADQVVADRTGAIQVQNQSMGRIDVSAYPAWFDVPADALADEDAITATLQSLAFRSAGALSLSADAPEGVTLQPLAVSSADSALLPVQQVQSTPDPARIMAEFTPTDATYTLAARLRGPLSTAFPDGIIPEATDEDDPEPVMPLLRESDGAAHVMIVGDVDMLSDPAWLNLQNFLGSRIAVPVASNGDFMINALENLSGAPGLIDLRGKGLVSRPFTLIEELEQKAETRFRATEQALIEELEDTTDRLRALQGASIGPDGEITLSEEQRAEIEQFRLRKLEIREELRAVQRNLRRDIDAVETTVRWLNMAAIPALAIVVAIGLAISRAHRRNGSSIVGG